MINRTHTGAVSFAVSKAIEVSLVIPAGVIPGLFYSSNFTIQTKGSSIAP
jgi:hypothetical protein